MNDYQRIMQDKHAADQEFDRRIRELQEACPHDDLTRWLPGNGHDARLCRRCNKTVETRAWVPRVATVLPEEN